MKYNTNRSTVLYTHPHSQRDVGFANTKFSCIDEHVLYSDYVSRGYHRIYCLGLSGSVEHAHTLYGNVVQIGTKYIAYMRMQLLASGSGHIPAIH